MSKINGTGVHLWNVDKFTRRRAIFRFLRRWIGILFATLVVLIGLNIHQYIRNRNLTANRTRHTVALAQEIIQDLQSTNQRAAKFMEEMNTLVKMTQAEMFRDQLAGFLTDALSEENAHVDFFDMVKVVECSQKYAVELSSLPFTYKDLIAIGWLESDFNVKAEGTHGERGIWQILSWRRYLQEIHRWDAYDIDNNCRMAVMELKDKYAEKGNYKDAIIAYNGWVIKDGGVRTTYYNSFMIRRRKVDSLCKKTEGKVNDIWK